MTETVWRAMTPVDLAEAERIADVVHADFPERPEVFAERLALFPAGCLVTEGGYAIAHPIRLGAPPVLDVLIGVLPPDADALHVHDVALRPDRQGRGLAAAAVAALREVAVRHGLAWLSLIAVHGSGAYWARFGFTEVPAPAAVASYGADARFMVCAAGPASLDDSINELHAYISPSNGDIPSQPG